METGLRHLRMFIEVVDQGSFSGAAERLGASSSAVSRAVSDLESDLGVRLLNRSTRRVALTRNGEAFAQRCRLILEDLKEARSQVKAEARSISGPLRVHAPAAFVQYLLQPVLSDFMREYPGVEMDLDLADEPPDLISGGYDVVIMVRREHFDAAITARRLLTSRVILCAAPEYTERHGAPVQPQDIRDHKIIDISQSVARGNWHFESAGRVVDVAPLRRSFFRTNSLDVGLAMACDGLGIVPVTEHVAAGYLARGELQPVLTDWSLQTLEFWAALPSRRRVEPRVGVFMDYLSRRFSRYREGV